MLQLHWVAIAFMWGALEFELGVCFSTSETPPAGWAGSRCGINHSAFVKLPTPAGPAGPLAHVARTDP